MDLGLLAAVVGFAGVERTAAGVAVPVGKYFCIVPQEDLTITAITQSANFSATAYTGKTLAKGIPFYTPFTALTLTGKADIYKTPYNWISHEKVV